MAQLSRFFQKIFGSNAQSQEIGRFGSLAANNVQYATTPAQVQELDRYLRGWFGAVVGNNSPAIQDVNALFFMITYQLAYIMQRGIPEWDDETTYYEGSICTASSGAVYRSLTDNNTNNTVSDDTNWEEIFTSPSGNPADSLTQNQINAFLTGLSLNGAVLTVTNQAGGTSQITLPTGGGAGVTSPADGLTQGEINEFLINATLTDSTLTFTQQDASTIEIALPSGSTSPADGLTQTEVDNLIKGASISGQTLTFTRQDDNTFTITIPTPPASAADSLTQTEINNLLNGISLSNSTLTVSRQGGDDITISLPSGGTSTTSPADSLTQGEINNLLNDISLSGSTLTISRQGSPDIVINNVGGSFVLATPWGDAAAEAAITEQAPARSVADTRFRAIETKPVAALTDANQNMILLGQPTFSNNILSFPIVDGGSLDINIGSVEIDLSGSTVTPELTDRLLIGDRGFIDNTGGFTRPSGEDEVSSVNFPTTGTFSFAYVEFGENRYLISKRPVASIYVYNFATDAYNTYTGFSSDSIIAWNPDNTNRPMYEYAGTTLWSYVPETASFTSLGSRPAFLFAISPVASAIKNGIWYFLGTDSGTPVIRAMRLSDLSRQESLELDISSIPSPRGFAITDTHFLFTSSDNSNLYSSQISTLSTPTVVYTLGRTYADITVDNDGNLWGAWNNTDTIEYRLEKYTAAAQLAQYNNAVVDIQDVIDLVPDRTQEIFDEDTTIVPSLDDRLLIGDRELVDNPEGFTRSSTDDKSRTPAYAGFSLDRISLTYFEATDGSRYLIGSSQYRPIWYSFATDMFSTTSYGSQGIRSVAWNPDDSTYPFYVYSTTSLSGWTNPFVPANPGTTVITTTIPSFITEIAGLYTRSAIKDGIWYFVGDDSGTSVVRAMRISDQMRQEALEPDVSSIPNIRGITISDTHFLFTSEDNSNLYTSQISTLDDPTVAFSLDRSYSDITVDDEGNLWGAWDDEAGGKYELEKYTAAAQLELFNNKNATMRSLRNEISPPISIVNPVESGAIFPATFNDVGAAALLTKGLFLRMEEDLLLDSVDAYIYPEANTETYRYVVAEIIAGTVNSVAGNVLHDEELSNELSLSGETITANARREVNFKYSSPITLEKGKTYGFAVTRTDAADTPGHNNRINIPTGTIDITYESVTPIFSTLNLVTNPDNSGSIDGLLATNGQFSRDVALQSDQETNLAFKELNFINMRESVNRAELLPSQTTIRNGTDITLSDSIYNYSEIKVFVRISHTSNSNRWIMLPEFVFRPSLLIQGTRRVELRIGNEAVGNNNRHFWLLLSEDNPRVLTMIANPTSYDGDALIMSIEGRK